MSPAPSVSSYTTASSSRLLPQTASYRRSPSPMSGPLVTVERWSSNPQSRFDLALAEDERRWVQDQGRPDRRLPPRTSNARSQLDRDLSQSVARAHARLEGELADAQSRSSAAMATSTSLRRRPRSASFELPPEHQRFAIRRAQSPSPEDLAFDESQPGHAHHLASRTERESSPYPFFSVAAVNGDDGQVMGDWELSVPSAPAWQEPPPSGLPPLPPPPSRWATLYPARSSPASHMPVRDRHGHSNEHTSWNSPDQSTDDVVLPPPLFPRRPRRTVPSPPPGQSLFSFAADTELDTDDDDDFGDEAAGLLSVHTDSADPRLRPVLPSLGIDLSSRPDRTDPYSAERSRRLAEGRSFQRTRRMEGWAGWGPGMGSDPDEEALQTARLELDWATRPLETERGLPPWEGPASRSFEKDLPLEDERTVVTEIRCGVKTNVGQASAAMALSSPTYLLPNPSLPDDSSTDAFSQDGCNALLLINNIDAPAVDLKFASLGSVGRGGGPSRTTYETVYPVIGALDGQGVRFGTTGDGHSSRCGCRDQREVACLNCGHTIGFHISAPCFLHSRDSQPSLHTEARYTPFPRIMQGDPLRSRYDNNGMSTASYTRRSHAPRAPAAKEGGLWGFRAGDVTVKTRRVEEDRTGSGAKKRKRADVEEGARSSDDSDGWGGWGKLVRAQQRAVLRLQQGTLPQAASRSVGR